MRGAGQAGLGRQRCHGHDTQPVIGLLHSLLQNASGALGSHHLRMSHGFEEDPTRQQPGQQRHRLVAEPRNHHPLSAHEAGIRVSTKASCDRLQGHALLGFQPGNSNTIVARDRLTTHARDRHQVRANPGRPIARARNL